MPKKVVVTPSGEVPPEEVEPEEDSYPTEISIFFRVVSVEPDTRQYMQRSKVLTHSNLMVAVKVPTSELVSYQDDAIVLTPAGFRIATDQLEGIYSTVKVEPNISSDWEDEPDTSKNKSGNKTETTEEDAWNSEDWDTETTTPEDTSADKESDDGFGDFDFGDDEVPF